MPRANPNPKVIRHRLAKTPTGIQGLDELTGGGLPKGRVSLVCGKAGCGKSLLAMEFLVHGAVHYGEPGVCMNFEETEEKLAANVASLGFDLHDLSKRKKLSRNTIQVSIREETAAAVLSWGSPAKVRFVNTEVTCLTFRKSTRRTSIDLTS